MARFPTTEGEVFVLAQNIAAGLTANAATYPAPPVSAVDLQAVLDSLITLTDQAVAAQAAAEQATVTKSAGLEELTDAMKAVLRYAEHTVDYDDAQLSLLGWAGRAAPTALHAPLTNPTPAATVCKKLVVSRCRNTLILSSLYRKMCIGSALSSQNHA